MVYLLALTLIVITVLVYMIRNERIIAPSMLFMIPFSLSAFYLILNIDRWSVVLNLNTYLVIVGGCISFLVGTSVGKLSFRTRRVKDTGLLNFCRKEKDINSLVFLVFLFVEVIILYLCLRGIRNVVHRYGFYGSLSFEIYRYRNLGIYTTESVSLGRYLDWAYSFNLAAGYIWAYIFAYRFANKKRISLILIACILVSLVTGFIKGGRQASVQMIISGLLYYMFFFLRKSSRARLPVKKILKIIILVAVIAVSFQSLGKVLGRTVQADFDQYIAVYLSGCIRNLNEWLKESHPLPDIFGKMTFANLYPYLGRKFSRPEWIYALDLPYLSANGLNSGNIYTTFYAYIYDFGYIGVAILPFIIGFISQHAYKRAIKRKSFSEMDIDIPLLFYGFVSYLLAFSFFSNKFYEALVSISTVRFLIFWFIIKMAIKHSAIINYKITFKSSNSRENECVK